MGKLVGILVALVVLLVVGDLLAREIAEDRVAASLQTSLALDDKPEVSLSGWPFVLRALTGNFSEVTIEGTGIAASDLDVSRVEIVLNDVSFPLGDALSGDDLVVKVESGSGRVEISERALQQVVSRDRPVRVELRGSKVLVSGSDFPETTEARAEIDGSRLALIHELGTLFVELPEIAEGVTYRDVQVSGGRITIGFELAATTLRAGARAR